jgi:hypothetical protein
MFVSLLLRGRGARREAPPKSRIALGSERAAFAALKETLPRQTPIPRRMRKIDIKRSIFVPANASRVEKSLQRLPLE